MLIISWGEWDGDMLPMKQSGLVTKGSVRNYWGGEGEGHYLCRKVRNFFEQNFGRVKLLFYLN